MGFIYMIISPNGTKYIGQTVYGVDERWRDHIYDALDPKKNHCKALNASIRKYNAKGFTIQTLLQCNDKLLNHYEELFISMYRTYVPFGHNIKLGGSSGKHSEETKEKIRATLKGKDVSVERRLKLSNTKNPDLPMYVLKQKKDNEIIGYRVCNHPNGHETRFVNPNESLEQKLEKALIHLNFLDNLNETKNDLPSYIYHYGKGYCVRLPNKRAQYFVSKLEKENYNEAYTYMEKHLSRIQDQRLNDSGLDLELDKLKI